MIKPRVLLSAYQCGPGMGSVSQIGWEWYSRLATRIPVTLVTHSRNRKCLIAAGAPLAGSDVIYIDTEWFAGPLYRFASRLFPKSEHAVFLISSADFFVYDAASLRELRKRAGDWDLVHAVTPVSPMAATRLHKLGIPLILGPWNGGLRSPKTFPDIMSSDSAWIYRVRRLGRILDSVFGSTKNASLVLTATKSTDQSLPRHTRTLRMIENGVDLELFHPGDWIPPGPDNPLHILFVGRLIPAKGISMLLEAISGLRDLGMRLTVIGDGPLRAELERETHERQLGQIVSFTGAQPLKEIANRLRTAHVFCLPSVRESGGAVLLESLASGVPILGVDYGGPAEIVDDNVGRKLSADGRKQLVADLVEAFRDIVRNPNAWRVRGHNGRLQAEQRYGWEARINTGLNIYQQVLQGAESHA
jgi:glycosyltransferase involved in cell wall biosynthesis